MERIQLKNVTTIVNGSTPSTADSENWDGDIAWITPKDLSNFHQRFICRGERNITKTGYDSCSTTLVPKGTVLLTSRAPIGYLAIANNPLCTNQGFKSLICDEERLLPSYLYYWLSTKVEYLKSISDGATFKELSKSTLGNVGIDLPDIETQQHIVGTIGSVDDLIENIESRKRCLNSILETSLKRYSSCVPFQSYHPILVKTGISPFDGDKVYLDTSCVNGTDPTDYSYIVQYGERPSRANMQPSPRTAWTARMKASFKVLGITELDSFILNNVILSTGFVGVQESENLPLSFLYALFVSKDFRTKKDLSSTGATMESINNKDFLDLMVPSLTLDEAREYKRKYDPIMLELSSLREQEDKLEEEKKLLLAKYF